MFTVKLFNDQACMSQSPVVADPIVRIIEAEEVEVIPVSTDPLPVTMVWTKIKGESRNFMIRYKTEEEMSPNFIPHGDFEFFFQAIIENSHGKTTEIVRARSPITQVEMKAVPPSPKPEAN